MLSAVLPVAVTMDFTAVTAEDYDRLMSALALTPQGPGLPGCLFHWALLTADGWTVQEIWQNRALFDVYRHDEIEPTYLRLQLPAPEVRIERVYSFLQSAGLIA